MKVRQIYKEHHDSEGSYDLWFVGKDCNAGVVVSSIDYHEPSGEGDAHYCDVNFSNGSVRRVFRPDTIDLNA